jgi:hypothetical protein
MGIDRPMKDRTARSDAGHWIRCHVRNFGSWKVGKRQGKKLRSIGIFVFWTNTGWKGILLASFGSVWLTVFDDFENFLETIPHRQHHRTGVNDFVVVADSNRHAISERSDL